MTDQGPRFLPGQQPIPYATLHGLPRTPYGMENGPVRLEGINDQPGQRFGGPQPEQINLDEESNAPAQPATPSGWRVKNAKGEVVASIAANPKAGQDYQKFQVQNIGQSLLSQAVTPEEKEAATRAMAYGMSLVGTMGVDKIQSEIVHRYDVDTGNAVKYGLQAMRSRNRGGGGGGAPGALGPTKADKWSQKLDSELRDTANGIIESERKGSKYTALAQADNEIAELEALINAPNAMSQREAIQRKLLSLTGKASRESEQTAISGGAGMWNKLLNQLSLWTSNDPKLTAGYIKQFRDTLAVQRQYINKQKQALGKAAAERAYAAAFGYPDDQRQFAYDYVNGAMTGTYGGLAAYPGSAKAAAPKRGGAPAAPAQGGGFDPDL